MKLSFRFLAKIGLLLVLIGFFMPVACKQTGFEIAQNMVKSDKNVLYGLLLYLMALSAAAGVFFGILLLMKNKIRANIDWLVTGVCIVSGLIVCFSKMDTIKRVDLQIGGCLILVGWIVAFVFQLLSTMRREK